MTVGSQWVRHGHDTRDDGEADGEDSRPEISRSPGPRPETHDPEGLSSTLRKLGWTGRDSPLPSLSACVCMHVCRCCVRPPDGRGPRCVRCCGPFLSISTHWDDDRRAIRQTGHQLCHGVTSGKWGILSSLRCNSPEHSTAQTLRFTPGLRDGPVSCDAPGDAGVMAPVVLAPSAWSL